MLGGERVLELGKVGGGLGFEKDEGAGEAGTQVITRRSQFAFLSFGAGRGLGVLLIGGDLGG